ncbi:MAG TPA: hypothetical protein VGG64_09200 [Pirellulales bacterium]
MTSPDRVPPIQADAGPMVSGKVVILGVFCFSVAAAFVSWIYYARLQERPLALWGSPAAELILRAPAARAYLLAVAPDAAEPKTAEPESAQRQFVIDGLRYVATAERDVSQARGFSHIRQGLIHDRSFAWDEPPGDRPPLWKYAVEFDEGGKTAVVAFADHAVRVALVDGSQSAPNSASPARTGFMRTVSTRPVAGAIDAFLAEQFPSEPPTSAQ